MHPALANRLSKEPASGGVEWTKDEQEEVALVCWVSPGLGIQGSTRRLVAG